MKDFLDLLLTLVKENKIYIDDAAALLAVRPALDSTSDTGDSHPQEKEAIAVIGMACRFPQANSPEQFWGQLAVGRDCISEIPPSRWPLDGFYAPQASGDYKSYAKWGGFIADIDKFDAEFFGISAKEARLLDPQQRLFLEIAYQTCIRAGYPRRRIYNSDTGVFVGARPGVYQSFGNDQPDKAMTTANMANFIAARVADFLSLKGPALTLDTACSSSLVAVHLACNSLAIGDCSMALVGGVDLKISPFPYLTLSIARALSPEGKSYIFDRRANGFVPGEGVGAVLLKPLAAAVRDGDSVYGVLVASAVNNDGHTMGITSPDVKGQKDVLEKAYHHINPETIAFVETHGTGTTIGDPIEIRALTEVYTRFSRSKGYCALGSVKSNIGHLDTAAGIASLIKVILALQHRQIPPTLHCNCVNPRFELEKTPFYINDKLRAWPQLQGKRRAAISSFGFGGTNCHLVVEQAPEPPAVVSPHHDCELLVLSAATAGALTALRASYREILQTIATASLADLCATAHHCRDDFAHRLALCADSAAAMSNAIASDDRAEAKAPPLFTGVVKKKRQAVVLMFCGQGSQYVGMGQDLYASEPEFARAIDACAAILAPLLPRPLLDYLFNADADTLKQTAITQPLTFVIDYALARLWLAWGLKPTALIGHSVGEYPAACIAGVLSLEDALTLVTRRGQLMQELEVTGTMAAVFSDYQTVATHWQQLPLNLQKELAIATSNGPKNTVIAGTEAAVQQFVAQLKQAGIAHKSLAVSHAFHSPLMTPMLPAFAQVLAEMSFHQAKIPIMSNVSGELTTTLDADYWQRHVLASVAFYPSIQKLAASQPIFIEVGPGRTLYNLVRQIAPASTLVLASLQRGRSSRQMLYRAAAQLFTAGVKVNPYAGASYRKLPLPDYPFAGKSYWLPQDFRHLTGQSAPAPQGLLNGCSEKTATRAVYFLKLRHDQVYFRDHIVRQAAVVAGMVWIEAVRQAAEAFLGASIGGFSEVLFLGPLYLRPGEVTSGEIILESVAGRLKFLVRSRSQAQTDWQNHASGIVITTPEPAPAKLDLAAIHSRCHQTVAGTELYAIFRRQVQIEHGPFFSWVRGVAMNADEFLSELAPSATIAALTDAYHLHPGLLDSAMQGMHAMVCGEHHRLDPHAAFIPFYFAEIKLHAPANGPCLAYARLAKITPEVVKFSISISDASGNVLVEINDAASKRIPYQDLAAHYNRERDLPPAANIGPEPLLPQMATPEIVDWFYRLHWQPAAPPLAAAQFIPGKWLLFADEHGLAPALCQHLEAAGHQVISVMPGSEFSQEAANRYRLRADNREDYQRLLETLARSGEELRAILYLWAWGPLVEIEPAQLPQQQTRWCQSLLWLAQTLVTAKISGQLWVITSYARVVAAEQQSIVPLKNSLWGMARVIAREAPTLISYCLDVAPPVSDAAVKVLTELMAAAPAPQVVYDQGQRYLPQICRLKPAAATTLPLKRHGVYLISGGLGGIGLSLAHYLAENYQAHLMLLGREQVPPAATWGQEDKWKQVATLQSLAASLEIFSVDIADYQRMQQLFATIARRHRRIDGVIHAAGVLEDGFFINKTPESLARVLAAKVSGTAILDQLTSGWSLDFFLMFSGLATIEATVSQIDYVAANCFLDSFAGWRAAHRPGISLTINWGLWGEVGMGTRGKILEWAKRNQVTPIPTRQGVAACILALSQGSGQLLISPDDLTAIESDSANAAVTSVVAPAATVTTPLSATATVEQFITAMIIAHTQQDPSRSDDEDLTFLELGMDSAGLVEMIHRLEDHFQIKLYPTLFFEYQTITELAAYLVQEFPQQIAAVAKATPTPDSALTASDIAPPADSPATLPAPAAPPKSDPAAVVITASPPMPGAIPAPVLAAAAEVSCGDIAVIGYSLRVPGATTPQEYWDNLAGQIESVTEVPPTRWDWRRYYHPQPGTANKTCCCRGGFVAGIDQFDPMFFNISPKEAVTLDPKQRLFMEVAWEALERAGYCGDNADSDTGVFVGASYSYYYHNLKAEDKDSPFASLGNGLPLLPNKLSFLMNFRGPSLLVDTYCSSALAALHLACRSLINQECRMALVGGAHAPLTPDHYLTMNQMQAISPHGRCRTFDDAADGYVPGEGVVAVLLKPLAAALADNDCIHLLIKASAVNHDGHANNITAPNAAAQSELITGVYRRAAIAPDSVSYIEAHGTGTSLGDPVELQGLTSAFDHFTRQRSFCALGSVKTNIGHLEPASGLASLVKIILALEHGEIPPTLHLQKANRHFDFSRSPFYINDRLQAWPRLQGKRRAGINSFGLSGSNAHVIVEEAPAPAPLAETEYPANVLVLSAKNRACLRRLLQGYANYLRVHSDWKLGDVCATSNTGRKQFPHKLALVASDQENLRDKLRLADLLWDQDQEADDSIFSGKSVAKAQVVFAFADSVDAAGIFAELVGISVDFQTALDDLNAIALEALGHPIWPPESTEAARHRHSPLLSFAAQYLVARTLQQWGIQPHLTMGWGTGAMVAATIANQLAPATALCWLAPTPISPAVANTPSGTLIRG